jgi:hypothetical protein
VSITKQILHYILLTANDCFIIVVKCFKELSAFLTIKFVIFRLIVSYNCQIKIIETENEIVGRKNIHEQ